MLQNQKETGTSEYIIQDQGVLAVFYTSPYLHYPKTPRDVWNDIYYCIVIDLRVKEFINFQIMATDTVNSSIGCGKKSNNQCFYARVRDFVGISYESRGPELDVDLLNRLKQLRANCFLKELAFEPASCNLGVWYSYPWI